MPDKTYRTMNESPLLDALLEHCQDIISIKDTNLRYVDCNRAFLEHFGLKSKDEVVGKSIFELIPEGNINFVHAHLELALKTKQPQVYTFQIKANASQKIVQQMSTPIINDGKIEFILSVSRDTTKDEALKHELISRNTQLNTLLEHLPILAYMKDVNRNYILGSKYSEQFIFHGYDPDLKGTRLDMNLAEENTKNEDEFVLQNKQILNKEKYALDIDGKQHCYNIIKAPIINNNNEIRGLVTIARNIDDRKSLENQKDLFIATLVHDLKNPLLAQISCIEQCYNGMFGDLNETQKEILAITLESAHYMKDMLYTLINTYKYDNGNIKLNKSDTNLSEIIKTCINEDKLLASERNVKLEFYTKLTDAQSTVLADKSQLRRVIANLLNNGINYAFKDTELKISSEIKNNNIKLIFENCGPPIDEDTQKHLFEKYISNANRFQKVGFGLGLYLSKKIMLAHGGDIYYENIGDLNRFIIELPLISKEKSAKVLW